MLVTGKPPLLEDEKPYPIEAAQASAMTVETTAYALLQALSRNDVDYATWIARRLTMQQNYGGGFHSMQDTIIALEVSSRCDIAFLKREEEINMQIQFHVFGSPIENTIHLRRHNALTEKELKDTIIALEASSRYYFAFLKREEEINMQIQFHGFGSPIENTIHLRRHNALTEKELKDTIIALEASSRYYFAFLKREEEINMKIQFHGFGSPIENTIHLRRHNALTEKELKFPLGRKIHIKLTGQGNGTLTNHTIRLF
ncbi:uncharacterized protein LOC132209039 [Stegostoma tigrinum]|uniref:uncharacterized protein LOC132209039 n=1 Tax=Stegostoma tigrinum TaxID=3053191 RepID=UPI00286FB702|nr:uncharacterized protein LOC132209039 [Stegostoma tigrinum]